jgi:DNA invertase Pin-like site-specific DNA recombinase
MSTEHQRYSPDNQQAAIAMYATLHRFEVVDTYLDSGKSGLTLSGRPALKRLLSDVLSGAMSYKVILVLDVSRWGRFQDTDQSAHYEFMCREAGVPVHYCNEPFQNDGGTMASIVKHMKRVMAAEYSRELSTKVSRAQRQQARLGFKQGGISPFATRRQVVDENGRPRLILAPGQRKALTTDRVILIWSTPEEVAVVRRVFRMFVDDEMSLAEIARWLNKHGHRQVHGAVWQSPAVRYLLRNELYIGKYVFGRKYSNVGAPYAAPMEDWARVDILKPIISKSVFARAAARLTKLAPNSYTNEELLSGLRRLLAENGTISSYLIQNSSYLSYPDTYIRRFGSLSAAYLLIGFDEPSHADRNALRFQWTEELLLDVIRRIYLEKGFVDGNSIAADPDAPSRSLFSYRFGGLLNAMLLAGLPIGPLSQRQEAALLRQRHQYEQRKKVRLSPIMRTAKGGRIRNEELDAALRRLLIEHGYLSMLLIDSDPTIPSSSFFRNRLGGLMGAYARIGYLSSQSDILKAAYKRARLRLPAVAAAEPLISGDVPPPGASH